jgi:hypothetical protein
MAIRIRRMVVRDEADIAAAQTGVRTRAVKCRGARQVVWVMTATNANALALVNAFITQDAAFDAPTGNFRDATSGADAIVMSGALAAASPLNAGGRIASIHHEAVLPLTVEQAELRFNSHATLTISGLKIVALIYDEVSIDVTDSGPVNAT